MRLPDELATLQTEDLVAKLSRLTYHQVAGIARIIAAGYHTETTLCPAALLTGPDRICTPDMLYRAGKWDDAAQRWRVTPGWARQPAFMEALNLAKRLALKQSTDEEYTAVAQAGRRARLASPDIIADQITIARSPAADNRDRTGAAKLILQYAALDAIPDQSADNPEADWWAAAEEDA